MAKWFVFLALEFCKREGNCFTFVIVLSECTQLRSTNGPLIYFGRCFQPKLCYCPVLLRSRVALFYRSRCKFQTVTQLWCSPKVPSKLSSKGESCCFFCVAFAGLLVSADIIWCVGSKLQFCWSIFSRNWRAETRSGKDMQHSGCQPGFGSGAVSDRGFRGIQLQRSPHFGGLPVEEEPVSQSCWWEQQRLVQEVVCPQERQLSVLLQEPRCKCTFARLHHNSLSLSRGDIRLSVDVQLSVDVDGALVIQ